MPETPETTTPETPVTLPDPVQANVTYAQTVGGIIFEHNPKTTAEQVKTRDGLNVETRLGTLEAAIAGKKQAYVKETIAERDALVGTGLQHGDRVFVIDATADATVEKGGAEYLYMTDNTWLKLSELESMDIICNWAHLQDKPTSTVAQIDLAVAKAHVHDNIETIAHLSDDGAGNLLFKGKRINDGKAWVATVASLADTPANLADGGLLIINPALAAGGSTDESEGDTGTDANP